MTRRRQPPGDQDTNRGEIRWPPMGRSGGRQREVPMAAHGEISMAAVIGFNRRGWVSIQAAPTARSVTDRAPAWPPGLWGVARSRRGDSTADRIITSQPIAPHARLRVPTPAHESPAPGRKPIRRTQARVRPGCQAEGPRKDPTRWPRHAGEQPMCSSPWPATCASACTSALPEMRPLARSLRTTPDREKGEQARRPVARVRRRSAAEASAPLSGDTRAFRGMKLLLGRPGDIRRRA
jgi:hypothetical protein